MRFFYGDQARDNDCIDHGRAEARAPFREPRLRARVIYRPRS